VITRWRDEESFQAWLRRRVLCPWPSLRSGYIRNRDRLAAELAGLKREEALLRVPGPLGDITQKGG
jgi:hypothetical protein